MRKEQCTLCGTELEIMPGVGEYCPNEDCPILDGPFDGSVPKAVIRAPAEPMAFVSEEWPASACASATARVTYAPGLEVDVMLKADATVEEKSLALAELIPEWTLRKPKTIYQVLRSKHDAWEHLCPYESTCSGLAQFAAILLEFPDVMVSFVDIAYAGFLDVDKPVTQASVLDEILRMNGKMQFEDDSN